MKRIGRELRTKELKSAARPRHQLVKLGARQGRSTRSAGLLAVLLSIAVCICATTTAALAAVSPVRISPPTVAGTTSVGETLTASSGSWSGEPIPDYSYQWQRCSGSYASSVLAATGDRPLGIAIDPAGNVYTANYGSNSVTKITPAGISSTLGTTGSGPRGIALDSFRNVYTANSNSNNVTKITPDGTSSTLGNTGTGPYAIAVDSADNIYTANYSANNVTKITPSGSSSVLGITDAGPRGLALDSSGNVYTANAISDTVTKITPAGASSTLGTTGSAPWAIAVDSSDNVYTVNYGSTTVTKITSSGSSSVYGSTGGYNPSALAFDSDGVMFVVNSSASFGSQNVSRIEPDGTSALFAATGADSRNIALDSIGNVYTTSYYSDSVYRVAPGGCVDIEGATQSTYSLQVADRQTYLRVGVLASNGTPPDAQSFSRLTARIFGAPPTNTQLPQISGTREVGDELTASPGVWSGTPSPSYSYQWLRCSAGGSPCVSVGSNQSSYSLTTADYAKQIKVTVTASNGISPSGTATSLLTESIAGSSPTNVTVPSVSGTAAVGQTLTASTGIWTGSPTLVYSYQWERCSSSGASCVAVGANQNTYSLAASDYTKKIRVTVTASNGIDPYRSASSALTTSIAGQAPSSMELPSITGVTTVGETLSANEGTWSGTPTPTYTRQWERCDADGSNCVRIGSGSTSYILVAADYGKKIKVTVTASNGISPNGVAESTLTAPIYAAAPSNTAAPSITGITTVGQYLRSFTGTWSGTPTPTYTRKWQRCESDGSNCIDIAADVATYTLVAADYGKKIKVTVTASNGISPNGVAESALTAPIYAAAPTESTPPLITGTTTVGQTLSTTNGTWSGTPTPTYARKWQRCSGFSSSSLGSTGTSPYSVALDASGNVYTANYGSDNVTKITPGGTSSTLGNTGTSPYAIAVDSSGNVYTANYGSDNVTKITPDGTSSVLGTTGVKPYSLALDSSGNVYTANYGSNNVTKITPAGSSSTLGTTGTSPTGIAVDGSNNVYTANSDSNNVTKITAAGVSSTLGTTGTSPVDLALDSSGNVYTANYDSDNVTKITAAGVSSTLGTTGTSPVDLALDSAGNVYTANYDSDNVTKITSAGVSSTLGSTDPFPISLALDRESNVYTASPDSNNVTKIAPSGCTDIGATGTTYVLQPADEARYLRSVVTASNGISPAGVAYASPTSLILASPTNASLPSITGTVAVGQTITASTGTWTGTPTPTYSYQWQRCDSAGANCVIIGSNQSTYDLVAADYTKKIKVTVTAANGISPNASATSSLSGLVAGQAPTNTTLPSIIGTTTVGQTLTSTTGTWSGTPTPTYSRQWQRCDADGSNCVNIGSNQSTYALVAADYAKTIKVTVTASNGISPTPSATSALTAQVAGIAPSNSTLPEVTGTAGLFEVVTASTGTWTGVPDPTYSYQWQRCSGFSSSTLGSTGAYPRGIALDSSGNVYTANYGSNNVTKITPAGASSTLGTTGNSPYAIAVDSSGNVYTANWGSNNVTKITPAGVSSTLGTTGSGPRGIALDSSGNVYTANSGSNNVTKITPAGVSSTFGTTAPNPRGIALDSSGNVYTANYGSNNVTKITPAGVSSTLGTTGNSPYAIAVDSSGNVYTANWGSNNVTKIAPSGCSNIADAVSASYSIQPADALKYLRVSVTATNGTSPDSSVSSLLTASVRGVAPANTEQPAISGTATVFETLTASPGSWTGIPDPDLSYQWQRCDSAGTNCLNIGSNQSTYTLVAADYAKKIKVIVAASNGTSPNASAASTLTSSIAGIAPANSAAPSITGSATVGQTLTTSTGNWSGTPSPSYSYQWQRCDADGGNCTNIGGNQTTYSIVGADHAKKIRVVVTASNGAGPNALATSPLTELVTGIAPANTTLPSVTGTTTVGQTLNASPGNWSGVPNPTYSYQWQRCNGYSSSTLGTTGTYPQGITLDSLGRVYTANFGSNNVTKITSAGSSSVLGTTGSGPRAVALDSAGNAYSANYSSNTVTKITSAGSSSTFGSTGSGPRAIAVDSFGTAYTANFGADNVTKITAAGNSSTLGATGGAPRAIALDSVGNVYTANSGSNNVTKITAGGTSSTLGSTGNIPYAIAVDSAGNVYTANSGSNNVTKITPGGTASTLGNTGTAPYAIAVDSSGNVYTANAGSNSVTKITAAGVSSTIGTTGNSPYAIAVDSAGNVYTANSDSNDVTKLAPSGCSNIPEATSASYLVQPADYEKYLRVAVTGSNDVSPNAVALSSLSSQIYAVPPTNTTPPVLSGVPSVGQALTATSGGWTGTPAPDFDYQWHRCYDPESVSGPPCAEIPGANEPVLALTAEDLDARMKVTVIASNGIGSPIEVSSALSGLVLAPSVSITAKPPSVTGSRIATFRFASVAASPTFQCKLDSGPLVLCSSPRTYRNLSKGQHVFRVSVISSGATSSAASWRWRVR